MNESTIGVPDILESSIEKFIKQLADGSLFDDISPEVMEIAQKIVAKNPNIADNI